MSTEMTTDLIEIYKSKDFDRFKVFVESVDNINKNLIKSHENSLNLLHICVSYDDTEFGLKCLNHLLSLPDIDINRTAKIDATLGISGAHIAVQWRHYNALKVLIDFGIDVFICDSYGNSAGDYADRSGDQTALQLINSAIHSFLRSETNRSLILKNSSNESKHFDTNAVKVENCFESKVNSYEDNRKFEQNLNLTNSEDLDQTIIYFNEKDTNWTESRFKSFDSYDSDNCNENSMKSNISYEKSDSIKTCCSDRTEIYVYNDRDHNVVLIEERYEGCEGSVDKTDSIESPDRSDVVSKGCVTQSNSDQQLHQIISAMNNTEIYDELRAKGDSPGPVIKTTKKFYVKRLLKLRNGKCLSSTKTLVLPDYSEELNRLIEDTFPFDEALKLEKQLIEFFEVDNSKRNYFNYILLDPNISQNIPFDANNTKIMLNCRTQINPNLLIRFIKSIFYVGKGQGNRVYQHFYEAIKITDRQKQSQKLERILDIWSTDKGVVSLHCFQDISSDEALAREAMIIEALMLSNLTNQVNGQNKCQLKWTQRKRRIFGSYLVYKSFLIHLLTGERQIRRPTIQTIQ